MQIPSSTMMRQRRKRSRQSYDKDMEGSGICPTSFCHLVLDLFEV